MVFTFPFSVLGNCQLSYYIRKDPFETYDGINGFHQIMEKTWVMQPAIGILTKHLETFKDFPPRQESASLDINKAISKILTTGNN